MNGEGALAVWNDCTPGCESNYENWYQTEHLPERLGVPGFRRGRRYQAIQGSPKFFTWYEVDSPDTLRSDDYKKCLSNPTRWTREIMEGVFVNASRTVCKREIIAGETFGSVAVTVRLNKDSNDQKLVQSALEDLYNGATIARIEKWTADEKNNTGAMEEESIRGPDQKIDLCFVLETMRIDEATSIAKGLAHNFTEATIGVYRLLCERPNLS
ncbi:MAG: hypothetical protein CMM58_01490 [Rhodospirillaceae bacterium]|nr:hypothetical protein [Rhodospirillaceae bacterium]|tara:strand:+ start:2428 stop:3066 length:639 start_codon:yes stop_codon:yes gene_type:complete